MAAKSYYAEWLGVTVGDAQPNHYQLLGLKEFEGDKARIEQAARRQREKLAPFLKGTPAEREIAERLLTAVRRAEYELSDPARRSSYDYLLKETREKGSPEPLPMAAVAHEQELLMQRDRAIEQANWEKAEEVARKLVSYNPQNASHQQVLDEVLARRARGARKALGLQAVKTLVLLLVLLGVGLLVANVVRRAAKATDTTGGAGGAKVQEGGAGSEASTTAGGVTRPGTVGAQAQADAAEAVTKAEKLLEGKKFAEALAAYKDAMLNRRAGGANVEQGLRSLETKIADAKQSARERAKAAEGQGDWAAGTQAYQDLLDLGEMREAQPRLQAMQAAAQAEQLEKAGKLEEAVTAYKKVVGTLADRTALDAKIAALEKQIAETRPKLKY
jgi:hypothetical protein